MTTEDLVRETKGLKASDYTLRLIILHISVRPMSLIGNTDIVTVGAFIDGFVVLSKKYYSELSDFRDWLADRFDVSNNDAWWNILRKQYSNNEDILRDLPSLFDEFTNSKTSKNS